MAHNKLGKNYIVQAILNKHKRLMAKHVPLKVFDKENVLFALSTKGLEEIILQAEYEQSMNQYERG